ncbi:MAG: glutathione S-transferase family protein [Pseudomonadales bacterium]
MLKLYHAPRTRSLRILWLLEELKLPYELESVEFAPQSATFKQSTPLGKLPVIEDGATVIGESGAIIEYILERYGEGQLAPAIGDPLRGEYLQWMHFSEGTAYPPLGVIIRHTRYTHDADRFPEVMEDARQRAHTGLDFFEQALKGKEYILGAEFSGADIMMGFTLGAALELGVLDDRYTDLNRYFERLASRPAFQKALAM